MRRRVILEPDGFTPGWRSLAGLVTSIIATGFIAAIAAVFAGQSYIASIAFILGCVVGGIFVAPPLVTMVLAKSFSPTVARVIGTAAVCSLMLAVFDTESFPVLSLVGGIAGLFVGSIWAWIRVPSYVNVLDKGICPDCGYSLVGLPAGSLCPECGAYVEHP